MARWTMRVGVALGLALLSSRALAAEPKLALEQPLQRTTVRGEPASLQVMVAAAQPWAGQLRVEVDGRVDQPFLPWSRETEVELAPGLHRIAVVGTDRRDGRALRSDTMQVAVFRPAARERLSPRARNGWTALAAFGVAIGGAAALRRRDGREH